jgi:hypothetical protein
MGFQECLYFPAQQFVATTATLQKWPTFVRWKLEGFREDDHFPIGIVFHQIIDNLFSAYPGVL